ncbi:hypothetical protein BV898_03614 [Hypsibius exemplaris]|uniref:NmrA-like domain-containing protein n=1 Tax=Hypsibius exemplaris TaxID=2072580 RepID=A0A1W0X4Q8_HYPEX|nr:hypothetical protein BV898_03614 [Hypsibius exemplaris]
MTSAAIRLDRSETTTSVNDWDTTSPHFVWHQLVETCIQASGLKWTHLHPAYFMENLFQPHWGVPKGKFIDWYEGLRSSWIAAEVIAEVAATVLREGPTKHHGKEYFLETQAFTGTEIAEILSQATGKQDPWFGKALLEQQRQLVAGTLPTLGGAVRDDAPFVTGKPSLTLQEFAAKNKTKLLNLLAGKTVVKIIS